MARKREPVDLGEALIGTFQANQAINLLLLDSLPKDIWRMPLPGQTRASRTIASTFSHIHNVQRSLLVICDKPNAPPPQVDRHKVAPAQVRTGLKRLEKSIVRMLREALASGGRFRNNPPNVVCAMTAAMSHDAHHRGQVCYLAGLLGHKIKVTQQMWDWNKRYKEATG